MPSGRYFLTAKGSHYLRGQNNHTTPLELVPGKSITGVQIKGYADNNADGDFADAGEEFDTLLAGEAGTEDNQIDASDVTAFANNFGLTTQAALDAADIDNDGDVDVDDFQYIAKNFGITAISPTGTPGVANAAPSGRKVDSLFELAGIPVEIELGEEAQVEVLLRNASSVVGYGFDLEFDSKKIAISDSAQGDFLTNYGKTFFVAEQLTLEEGQKKLAVGNALIRKEADAIGEAKLLQFTLKPVAVGDVVLTIGNAQLNQRDGHIDLDGASIEYRLRIIPKKIVTKSVLLQNYPNPFNPETWMPYAIKDAAHVKLHIYDAVGQRIRTLDLGFQKSSEYFTRDKAAYWDGRNDMGERIASGVYFYRIEAGSFSDTRKMVILK